MKQYLLGLFIVISLTGCKSQSSMKQESSVHPTMEEGVITQTMHPIVDRNSLNITSPVVFVYQTKGDFYDKVPVILNEDGTQILSYPAPSDLKRGDALALPTRLDDGWLLDNRGIGPTVAFLSYTYEEYSKMKTSPSVDELMQHIISKDPLKQWRICGRRADYTDIVPQLNDLIKNNFKAINESSL